MNYIEKNASNEIIRKWRNELLLLSNIAAIQPEAAYSAYVHGFKSNLVDVLRKHFIHAITSDPSISEHLLQLIALPI